MDWFSRRHGKARGHGPDPQAQQAVGELIDRYHSRASVSEGEKRAWFPSMS